MQEDFRWFWAAYQLGWAILPPGLSASEFRDRLIQHLEPWAAIFVALGRRHDRPGDTRIVPVGIIGMMNEGYRTEVHADWFPWASGRNKLECWAKFLVDMRKERLGLIYCERHFGEFFDLLAAYGLLKPKGPIRKFWGETDALFYYTVR